MIQAFEFAAHAAATARLARDWPRSASNTVTTAAATRRIRDRIATRSEQLLLLARRSIYPIASNPIRRLLLHAGCGADDFDALIRREGVEGGLDTLRTAGVYVTQAELKGRAEIVRGSLRFMPQRGDWVNPRCRTHFIVPTSGSTGASWFVGRSLSEQWDSGDVVRLALDSLGFQNPAQIKWSILPHTIMQDLRAGMSVVAWHNTVPNIPPAVWIYQFGFAALARVLGITMAWPTRLLLDETGPFLDRLVAIRRRHGDVFIDATPSAAARVSHLAFERGVSLERVLWRTWGEPLTPERWTAISRAGGRALCSYSCVETGSLGMGCGQSRLHDAVHLRTDRFAFVQPTGTAGQLLVTALSDTVSTVFLNVEMGDVADPLDGACDCCLHAAGLTRRIANIRGRDKLTSAGVTIDGDRLVTFVEVTLPARFGGRLGDYQLAEVSAANGGACLVLRVDPSVGSIDDLVVREELLREVAAGSRVDRHMADVLRLVDSIGIERTTPWTTASGKRPPVVPLGAMLVDGTRSSGPRA